MNLLQIDPVVASFEHLGGVLISTYIGYKTSSVIPPLMLLQHLLWRGMVCHESGKRHNEHAAFIVGDERHNEKQQLTVVIGQAGVQGIMDT